MAAEDLALCINLNYLVVVREHLEHWLVFKPYDELFEVEINAPWLFGFAIA